MRMANRPYLIVIQAARENRLLSANSEPTSPSRGVKRTVGYMDEEDGASSDVPTNKMTKLSIKEVVMAEGGA